MLLPGTVAKQVRNVPLPFGYAPRPFFPQLPVNSSLRASVRECRSTSSMTSVIRIFSSSRLSSLPSSAGLLVMLSVLFSSYSHTELHIKRCGLLARPREHLCLHFHAICARIRGYQGEKEPCGLCAWGEGVELDADVCEESCDHCGGVGKASGVNVGGISINN